MSKAFTKESDDGGDLDEVVPEPKDPLPPGVKNYVTPAGAEALRVELNHLETDVRPRLSTKTDAGATDVAFGSSLSPKTRIAAVERQIRFLRDRVSNMVVVDPKSQDPDRVRFGATVTVCDPDGNEKTYTIVGVDESDPALGKVSFISPVARALMSAEEGDVVKLQLPDGETELEILSLDYRA